MKLSLCGWGQMLWKLKCCNQTQISICLYGITLLLQIRVCDSRCCECNSRLLVLCIPMKYLPTSSIQMYRVRSEAAFFVVFCFVFIILFGREWNLHLQGEGSFPAVLLSLLAFTLWKCCDNRWWVREGKQFPTNSWCLKWGYVWKYLSTHAIFSMLKKTDFQATRSTRILCSPVTFRFFAQASMIVGENVVCPCSFMDSCDYIHHYC